MPFVSNPIDEIRIHYEVHGSGQPILLHHGGGSSLERWHELGYVRALQRDFQLVLIDARGHGKSSRPHHASAYSYRQFVSDLVTVLDHAGIERAHFFGYSLGGLIGFRIPMYAQDRFRSLILDGAHPYEQYDFFNRQFEMFRDGLDGFIRTRQASGHEVEGQELQHLAAADLDVYAAVGEALRHEPEAFPALERCKLPKLLFVGEDDNTDCVCEKLPQAADRLSNTVLLTVPGHTHRALIARPDLIIPAVCTFLQSISADALPLMD